MRRYAACALVAACLLIGPAATRAPAQGSAPAIGIITPDAAPLAPFWADSVDQEGALFGSSVASGDLNGDGIADIIVGAPSFNIASPDEGKENEGRVFVYLGSTPNPSSSPSYTLDDPARGYIYFGTALASGGDFDHDGRDDLLVGVPNYFRGFGDPVTGTGRVYLYRGISGNPVSWPGIGTSADRAYGTAVAFAGDVNGDGYDDILVGDPLYSGDHPNEGRVLFYFGGPSGPHDDADRILVGGSEGVAFGSAVSAAGDVNHDGYADVVIGASGLGVTNFPGIVLLYLGSPSGPFPLPYWSTSQTGVLNLGRFLRAAGDVNGDGNPDILAGGQWFGTPVTVLFQGTGSGLQAPAAWSVTGGVVDFGSPIGSGDFNHDGYSDVAVGMPGGGSSAEGKVSVYLGSPHGLNTIPGWEAFGGEPLRYVGRAVAVGDVDGDGSADVIAGAPGDSFATPPDTGEAFGYRGVPKSTLDILDPMCTAATECRGTYLLKQPDGSVIINPNPDVVVGATVRRPAAATDGVTRLLLRLKSDVPVTFRLLDQGGLPLPSGWGLLRSLDGASAGGTITVQPQAVGAEQYVFAEYRTPIDFPGSASDIKDGVPIKIEADSPQGNIRAPLTLKVPPVVLVHGLWSDSEVWKEPSGGLLSSLQGRGYTICPDCRVDYRGPNSAASFDPWAETPEDQFAVRALVAATDAARDWMRAQDTAVTQVDVVAHSLGALMTRSRVAYRQWPYRRFMNYGAGDFHKLISIGSPHTGSPLATTFLEHRCQSFILGFSLQTVFSYFAGPFGPGLFQLQPGSDALSRIGAPSIVQVPTYPIVGLEPAHVQGCTESCTEDKYNRILRDVHEPQTIDDILGGEGYHDTLVPFWSQRGGIGAQTTDVLDVVHTDSSKKGDPAELTSGAVWDEVDFLLKAPLSRFYSLPPNLYLAEGIADDPCPSSSSARAAVDPSVTVILLPSPGTIVSPGETVSVRFEIQGGNPVDGADFVLADRFDSLDGPGPFVISFEVPRDRLGDLPILAGTVGPGPDNYSASTFVTVVPQQPPVSISVSPARLTFFRPGELQGLVVTGRYADGSEVNLTSASSGTIYAAGSGTATVVAPTPDGLVRAIASGSDEIVVSSFGHAAHVPVQVTLGNLAPVVVAPASVTVEAEQMVQVQFSATDPEQGPFTLGVDGLPAFATFTNLGGGLGQLTLHPQIADLGTYTVLISATDEGDPPFAGTARMTIAVVPCQQPLPGRPELSLDGNTLSWTPASNATAYDLVGGFVEALRNSRGDFSVSTAACVANDRTSTSLNFFGTPAPGTAIWFLVRGVSCAGNGSYDDPLPSSQIGSRDPGIAAAPAHCP